MIYNKTESLDLITSLITLEVILKKIDRISLVRDLELEKLNKRLKELEAELLQENYTKKRNFGGRSKQY